MLVYVFDEQGEGVPELEGIGNSGDSGGPALVWNATTEQWNIGGVKSNGACCDYGAENEYTRLGGIAYSWIMDNITYDENGPTANVPIEEGLCEQVWFDPSNDGNDWEEMFGMYDDNPKDEKVDDEEFGVLFEEYACKDGTAAEFFTELDANGDGELSVVEFKGAWSWF